MKIENQQRTNITIDNLFVAGKKTTNVPGVKVYKSYRKLSGSRKYLSRILYSTWINQSWFDAEDSCLKYMKYNACKKFQYSWTSNKKSGKAEGLCQCLNLKRHRRRPSLRRLLRRSDDTNIYKLYGKIVKPPQYKASVFKIAKPVETYCGEESSVTLESKQANFSDCGKWAEGKDCG